MGDMADYYADLATLYEDEIFRQHYIDNYLKSDYLLIRSKLTWETKDGNDILVKEMKQSHIENCIKMLSKNNVKSEWINIFNKELKIRKL